MHVKMSILVFKLLNLPYVSLQIFISLLVFLTFVCNIFTNFNCTDPDYDVEKDVRRDNLLLTNDYHDLKLELKDRGLSTSGDKISMMTRLLLNIIDPALDYNKL